MPDHDAVVVGVAGHVENITSSVPINEALTNAMGFLPAEGGDLYVLPGSTASPYLFGSMVLIDRPNVTLRFSRGARLDFLQSTTFEALIKVIARGFRCVGPHVQRTVEDTDSGRSCFLVDDGMTSESSNDAAFEGGVFDMKQSSPNIVGFSCIRARGASATTPRCGLTVCGSTFFIRLGTKQAQAWSGADPGGVCGIRASNSAETIVATNRFNGEFVGGPPRQSGRCGPLVYLVDSPHAILHANTCRYLDLITVMGDSALVRLTNAAAEGHQSLLVASMLEGVSATHILEFLDLRDVIVAAGNFGRLAAGTLVGIRAASKPGGSGGDTLVVYGINCHNVGGATGHMIEVESTRNVAISPVALTLIGDRQVPIAIADGSCANIVVDPNQARSEN